MLPAVGYCELGLGRQQEIDVDAAQFHHVVVDYRLSLRHGVICRKIVGGLLNPQDLFGLRIDPDTPTVTRDYWRRSFRSNGELRGRLWHSEVVDEGVVSAEF